MHPLHLVSPFCRSSSLSKEELRDRLEEFCISNELLRDEIKTLRTDIRGLEQVRDPFPL